MISPLKNRPLISICAALIALALSATACAKMPTDTPKSDAVKQTQVPANSDTYELGAEDVLTIYVRNVPEMSGEYLIQLDGTIYFPVVGQVKAAGMSAKELQQYLEKGLSKELRDPQVTVNIKTLRPNRIYIYGSISKSGVYDYRKGWRLSELIAVAGGLALPPERVSAILFRPGNPNLKVSMRKVFIDADDAADFAVQPGDSINIQTDAQVRVNIVGEAKSPGVHELFEGQGVVEALASGGGQTDRAALSRAKVIRRGKEMPINLYAAVIDGDTSNNMVMEDNDTLEIPQQYQRVAVSGQVGHPGAIPLPDGRPYTLADAISEAGGAGSHSKREGCQLLRVGPDGKTHSTTYNLKLLGTKGHPNPVLQDKDVVFVPESGAPSLNDFSGFLNLFWVLRTFTSA